MLKMPPERHVLRHGFSLVEVLIALALTVLLLSAVYAAVDLHLRFQTAGRAQIAQSQLMRAVIRTIDRDVSAVVFAVDQNEEDDESEDDTSSVENPEQLDDVSDTALTVGGLESEGAPVTFGIVGTAEVLHLCISQPSRDLAYDALRSESPTSERLNDLTIVSYGIGPVDPATLIDPRQPKYAERDLKRFTNRPLTGFGRRSLDLYLSGDSATDTLGAEDVLAPEIVELQFAYFDGTAWLDSWDSRSLAALPRAIRVTFGLWSPPSKSSGVELNVMDSGNVQMREHVFDVPLSVPILDDLSTPTTASY